MRALLNDAELQVAHLVARAFGVGRVLRARGQWTVTAARVGNDECPT